MASEDKKSKTALAPKSEAAVKNAVAAKKNDQVPSKDKVASGADAPKAEAGEKTEAVEKSSDARANYSRGEGQKPVSKAYKENWNAIYGKKKKKKR
jgi:hypothetical protein